MNSAPTTSRRNIDVVAVLTCAIVLRFFVPSIYIVGPLQAVGSIATPGSILAALALVWWLSGRLVPGLGLRLGRQPLRIAMLLFLLSILLAMYSGSTTGLPPDQASSGNRGVLYVLCLIGITLLAADGIASLERLTTLLRRLVLATAIMAAIGVVQYVTKFDFVSGLLDNIPIISRDATATFAGTANPYSSLRRVSGTAVHPIEFAVVLAMILPLAFHFALSDRDSAPIRRWWKVGVIAVAMPMAQSRSGIVAIVGAAVVFVPVLPRVVRQRILWSIPIYIPLMRVAFPGLVGTIRDLFLKFAVDPSYTSRTEDYQNVGYYIRQHPWLGRGFQTFLPRDFFFLDNQYLMSTIETGYVGLVAIIAVLATGIGVANQARRWAGDQYHRILAQALLAGIVGAAVAFATFDFLSFELATTVLFLLMGCAGAAWRLLREQARAEGRLEPRRGRPLDVAQA